MDREYLKTAFAQVAEGYPKVFNYDEWVGFSVTRSMESCEDGDGLRHSPGPLLYVKASPGNGTEYRFYLIQGEMPGFPDGRMLLVFDPDQRWGSMWIKDFSPHPNYLTEKLGMGVADAVAMAVILGRLNPDG
jgi:hypothetical protein